jgi:hypothetical protein
MTPTRSSAHLKWIRTQPCVVCFSKRNVEAAHVGSRGMGQKCSDLETIPLCQLHHREQHRIGLKGFVEKYKLDLKLILWKLTCKPVMKIEPVNQSDLRSWAGAEIDGGRPILPDTYPRDFVCYMESDRYRLCPVSCGIKKAWQIAKDLCCADRVEQVMQQCGVRVSNILGDLADPSRRM